MKSFSLKLQKCIRSIDNYLQTIVQSRKRTSLSRQSILLWFGGLLILAFILTLLIPPLQKPDEYLHLQKAVSISNGLIVCTGDSPQVLIQNKYGQIFDTVDKYGITQNYKGKFYHGEFIQPLFARDEMNETVSMRAGLLCNLPSISYPIQTVGILISNLLNLNFMYSFYVGRLLPVLVYFFLLYLLIKKSSYPTQLVLLMYTSIPMLLHQLGSYSYDSFQIVLGLLLTYLLFTFVQSKTLVMRHFYVYASLLLLLHFTKPGSYWLLFASPLFFIDKILSKKNWKKTLLPIVLFYIIAAALFIYPFIMQGSTQDTKIISPMTIQSEIFFSDPINNLFRLIHDTLRHEFMFYFGSFLGNFGWLDHSLGLSAQILILCLLIYVGSKIRLESPSRFPVVKGFLAIFILIASFTLVILGMYLGHTALFAEIGGLVSFGGQGRYFLLLTPILLLLFGLINQSKKLRFIILALSFTFVIYKTGETVFLRYYDYQSLYDIPAIDSPLRENADYEYVPVILNSTTHHSLEIDRTRRLKGVTLGYIPSHTGIWLPYVYKVRDGNCNAAGNILAEGYIQKKDYRGNQLNILFPRPLDEKGQVEDNVCVGVAPYILDPNDQKQFTLLEFADSVTFAPIYLR